MISYKRFGPSVVDGTFDRFLSEFIIPTEQHTRVYNYVYDPVNGSDTEHIVDPVTGLYLRASDFPNSVDLQGLDKWDLIDNSIAFYTPPPGGSTVYFEVATTPEEFGDTLTAPAVSRAETAAAAAEASATAAASSETNAGASETGAAASASAAATSETNAASSASASSASASAAATSEANAATSETNAGTSETNAAASASAAATSETNAGTSETNAAASASAAATSETNAATSEANAATSESNTDARWLDFDQRNLGAKASDPTLDNQGGALQVGAMYYNTVTHSMREYNGATWDSVFTNAATLNGHADTDFMFVADTIKTFGRLGSPMFYMPLSNDIDVRAGKGTPVFTRASTATYIDKYGILQTAAVDTPRFERDGLLMEGSTVNLLTYSNTFTDASWQKVNTSVLSGYTGPDGTLSAFALFDDATTNIHTIQQNNLGLSDSTIHCHSVFAKAGTLTKIGLYPRTSNEWESAAVAKFDLVNGVVLDNAGFEAGMIELADGWWRVWAKRTTSSGANADFAIALLDESTGNTTFLGTGTDQIFISGAQLEANFNFPTSYVPTTTAAVTRNSEYLNVEYTGNVTKEEVSICFDFDILGLKPTQGNQAIYSMTENWTAWRHIMYYNDSIIPIAASGNSTGYLNTGESLSFNTRYSWVDTRNYSASRRKVAVNGVVKNTGGCPLLTWYMDKIHIGTNNSTTNSQHFGHIKNFRIYDSELTDTEIALVASY